VSPVLQKEQDFLDELCEALDAESPIDTDSDQTHKPDCTMASKYALLETGYDMHIGPKD
jgi:hypothetical protein